MSAGSKPKGSAFSSFSDALNGKSFFNRSPPTRPHERCARDAVRAGAKVSIAYSWCPAKATWACSTRDDFPQIDVVTCRHEAGAGFMACADGRLTRRPGVFMVSRGPGASQRRRSLCTQRSRMRSADPDRRPGAQKRSAPRNRSRKSTTRRCSDRSPSGSRKPPSRRSSPSWRSKRIAWPPPVRPVLSCWPFQRTSSSRRLPPQWIAPPMRRRPQHRMRSAMCAIGWRKRSGR